MVGPYCCTACPAEREMVFIKLAVQPGEERTEVLQLVDIFRARVIDNSDRTLTLSVTGDAGKVGAPLQRNPRLSRRSWEPPGIGGTSPCRLQ